MAKATLGMALLLLLAGCSSMTNAHLGIRPDVTPLAPDKPLPPACDEYKDLVNYTESLQEAYHTRASQNRFWIYAAGTVALGTVAATGGLGAAGVAGLSIALVSVSGGFTSGVFTLIDNSLALPREVISRERGTERRP